MKVMKRVLVTLVALSMVVSPINMGKAVEVQAATASKVKILNGKSKTIYVGDKSTIICKITPKNASQKVSYTSSSKKIAKVSKKGVITGVKPGKATITVKAKDGSKKKAKVKVTVLPKKVKGVSAAVYGNNGIKVSWTAQKNVTGYQILLSTKKSSGYKVKATVKGASKNTATITNLAGGVYYVKVRAYKTISGKKKAGKNSSYASAKVWKLVWSDEFNYTDKSRIEQNWKYEVGDGSANGIAGWGNNELQYYTAGDNVILDGKNLIIQPGVDVINGREWYTSTRLVTKNKKQFKYGKIEFSLKVPSAQGTWAAAWMLGTGSNGGWPACGEIDIMETYSNTTTGLFAKDVIPQTIHNYRFNGMPWSPGCKNKVTTVPGSTTGFHTYGIIWNEDVITFTIDGKETWTYNPALYGTVTNNTWPFNNPAYLIMNVAVGGTLGGSIVGANGIEKTILDRNAIIGEAGRMYCDWVRVYQ